jgi:uncharacterized protein YaaW (UPF0174 family)
MNIFTKAKAYQKKHPKTAWQDCIQAVKVAPKKAAQKAVGKVSKSVAPKLAKKVTVKVTKRGKVNMSIGAVSLGKISQEQTYLDKLTKEILDLRGKIKGKEYLAAEKAEFKRLLLKNLAALKISKQHITALKKLL